MTARGPHRSTLVAGLGSTGVLAALVACALVACALVACESAPLDASCGGGRVELCGPREWADLSEASFEPEALPIADFSRTAHIRVAIARCADAPEPHEVELSALIEDEMPNPDGGGVPVQLVSLLTLAEGADGDTPGDGVIDVEVTNPLIGRLPEESDITLRFVARSRTPGGCTSGTIEIPYRTGPR